MTGKMMYLLWLIPVLMTAFCVFWVIRNIRMGRGKIRIGLLILESVAVIVGTCFLVSMCFSRTSEGTDVVKKAYPSSIPTITYGQAIDSYCADTSWIRFTSDKGDDVVQVTGTVLYHDKDTDMRIQFLVNKSGTSDELDGSCTVEFVGLDGATNSSQEEMTEYLYLMFQNYASKNGISLDEETAKAGILTSQSGNKSIQENSSQSSTEEASEETPETSSYEGETEGDAQTEGVESCVEQIKGATPSDYSTEMTFGDAFASFFKNATWSAYGDDGTMVEFTGIFILDGEECQADIIFTIEEDGSFDMSTMTCDGEERNYEDWLDLRKTVFDNYEEVLNSGESGY